MAVPGATKAGDRKPSSRFRYPTATEIQRWGEGADDRDAAQVARRVARRSRLFLTSTWIPVAVAAVLTWLLALLGSPLSDAQYGALLLFLAGSTFLTLLQWRQIAIQFWPGFAIDYYCSAVLNRLRGRVLPSSRDHAYLAAVLPDLERALTSDALVARVAGSSLAKEQLHAHCRQLARALGEAEVNLLRTPREETVVALRRRVTALLLNRWSRLPTAAITDVTTATSDPPAGGPTLAGRLATKFVNKSADQAIEGVVTAVLVIVGGLAWR